MKLVKITGERVKASQPFIHVHIKGVIRFSNTLCREISLKDGDSVAFFQDLDNPDDFYFKPKEPGNKVRLISDTGQMLMNSATIARQILKPVKKDKARIMVSLEPVRDGYYPIITASAL